MIVITRRTTVSGLLAIALLPAACASPSPVLYTLDQVPGVTRPHGPHVVMLRDIGLAPYLDRQQIVRSSSNYRIDVEANNWWGESFGAMMIRVLTAEIDQRLPGTSVYSESGAISCSALPTRSASVDSGTPAVRSVTERTTLPLPRACRRGSTSCSISFRISCGTPGSITTSPRGVSIQSPGAVPH